MNKVRPRQLEQCLQEWFALFLTGTKVLFCASAGGMRSSMKTGAKMKRAGYKRGFPDMMILEPVGEYHGLFIELKVKGGTVKEDQKEWKKELIKRKYCSVIMPTNLSFQEGQDFLEDITNEYLKGEL